jgi:hypothetical protein
LPNGFGAFNRIHERSGEAEILESVCFNKCSTCIVNVSELSDSDFDVYPNPFSDQLNIEVYTNDQSVLSIVDVSGRIITQMTIQEGQNRQVMKTSAWPAGAYFLRFENETNRQSKIFIKH